MCVFWIIAIRPSSLISRALLGDDIGKIHIGRANRTSFRRTSLFWKILIVHAHIHFLSQYLLGTAPFFFKYGSEKNSPIVAHVSIVDVLSRFLRRDCRDFVFAVAQIWLKHNGRQNVTRVSSFLSRETRYFFFFLLKKGSTRKKTRKFFDLFFCIWICEKNV